MDRKYVDILKLNFGRIIGYWRIPKSTWVYGKNVFLKHNSSLIFGYLFETMNRKYVDF
jgi:hypothetical protein